MGRGYTSLRHQHKRLCRCFVVPLDIMFWCSICINIEVHNSHQQYGRSCSDVKVSSTQLQLPITLKQMVWSRDTIDSLKMLYASDWFHHDLPWVLLGILSAPKEDSTVSSAELLYGTPLTLPGQFLNKGFQQDFKNRIKVHSLRHHLTIM